MSFGGSTGAAASHVWPSPASARPLLSRTDDRWALQRNFIDDDESEGRGAIGCCTPLPPHHTHTLCLPSRHQFSHDPLKQLLHSGTQAGPDSDLHNQYFQWKKKGEVRMQRPAVSTAHLHARPPTLRLQCLSIGNRWRSRTYCRQGQQTRTPRANKDNSASRFIYSFPSLYLICQWNHRQEPHKMPGLFLPVKRKKMEEEKNLPGCVRFQGFFFISFSPSDDLFGRTMVFCPFWLPLKAGSGASGFIKCRLSPD